MPDEEYRIRLDFLKSKISSVPYLMKTYKITSEKAFEYLETLSYMADKWSKNANGQIIRVLKK